MKYQVVILQSAEQDLRELRAYLIKKLCKYQGRHQQTENLPAHWINAGCA